MNQAPLYPHPNRQRLGVEVVIVFLVQLALVLGLVVLDRSWPMGGNLHAMVGAIFVLLPVLVLDRTDKAYRRYGINWGRPLGDLSWALIAAAVAFPPIALFSPMVWGLDHPTWSFAWPSGYPEVAFSHLVVVALPEEIFYRGYVMGRLDDVFGTKRKLLGAQVGWSLPIQAVLFALGHFLIDFQPQRLAVFFPALAFGWLKSKRGSIVPSVLFHAASNIFMEVFRAGYGLGL